MILDSGLPGARGYPEIPGGHVLDKKKGPKSVQLAGPRLVEGFGVYTKAIGPTIDAAPST